jgi:hypothetical protein
MWFTGQAVDCLLGPGQTGPVYREAMLDGCLGSLATPKPLMYRLALEFTGPDTPRGREFAGMMPYTEFRHLFRVITVA